MAPPPLRGPSSRTLLDMEWHYPTYTPEEKASDGRSSSVAVRRALPLEEVWPILAGEDRRPLLVLRECLTCTGTDDALLTKNADNEKTMLLSQWFRCVKVAPDVLEEDHPFHALFEEKDPAHLFVARFDGSGRVDLDGQQSRTELWKVMGTLLKTEYAKKHEKPLKKLFGLMGDLDNLDDRISQLEGKLSDALESEGLGSRKVKKLKKELTEARAELSDLREQAVQLAKLPLKEPKKKA